jgi:hypothetical protein
MHETYHGPDIPGLLKRARAGLGDGAVVLSVRRRGDRGFEMLACDAASAPARREAPARPQPMALEPVDSSRRPTASPSVRAPERASVWPHQRVAQPRATERAIVPDDADVGPALRRRVVHPVSDPRLTSMLPCLGDYTTRKNREPVFIALVGPTGSGKTTTIAKLARHPEVFDGLPVGLLCLDTYRIGAVEQLSIYADIARLPLEVVYDASDLKRAMKKLRECEIVLVDTAGRGPGATADVDATVAQLAEIRPAEVHLTVPAGLQLALARGLINRHRAHGVTHLIATKRDEFPDDASVFELAAEWSLPMRWVTTGQEVPDDLEAAATWFDAPRAGAFTRAA